jgi:hypothetical protein
MSCSSDPASLTSSSTCAGGGAMDPSCQDFVIEQHKQQVDNTIYKVMFFQGFTHKRYHPLLYFCIQTLTVWPFEKIDTPLYNEY